MQQSQRIIMYVLPFAFIFVIARFPAGLVLYWMTTNLWTVGQGLITRRLIPKVAPPTPQKRTSRTQPKEEEAPAPAVAPAQPASQPRRVKRKKKARR
jgi:YidC/Oxa1 family membrane protein insertase